MNRAEGASGRWPSPAVADPRGAVVVLSATPFETEPLRLAAGALAVGGGPAGPAAAGSTHWAADPQGPRPWPPTLAGTLDGVPVLFVTSGLGKANAAAAVAALAAVSELAAPHGLAGVLQVGVGGAYPGSGLALGAAVVAASEFDLDLGVGRHPDWRGLEAIGLPALPASASEPNRIELDPELVAAVSAACGCQAAAFATSDSVTADAAQAAAIAARHEVAVESMEGVGAAQAALAMGLSFVEIRGVSNRVGERDRREWRLADAVAAACGAARGAVAVLWGQLASSREDR